jgi:hypothetical protein
MSMIVLPRIEIDNPFGALAKTLKDHILPFTAQLVMNEDKIVKFSDTELTDHIPVLSQFAPDLLTQDGKINWSKVEEYGKSEDLFKQKIANYLSEVKKMREEYANLPLVAKLEQLSYYSTATNPLNLKKNFMIKIATDKYQEALNKANLPAETKLFFLAFAPEFAEKVVENPEYFNAFLKIFEGIDKKKQDTTRQEGGTGSWRMSLDKQQKKFGIQLEKPQLNFPQISPPQIPKVVERKPVVKQGGEGKKKTPPSTNNEQQKTGVVASNKTGQSLPTKTEQPSPNKTEQFENEITSDILFPSDVPYASDVKNMLSREELEDIGKYILEGLSLLALLRNPRAVLMEGGKIANKINELKDLLKKRYSKTATKETTKKKKSNK